MFLRILFRGPVLGVTARISDIYNTDLQDADINKEPRAIRDGMRMRWCISFFTIGFLMQNTDDACKSAVGG